MTDEKGSYRVALNIAESRMTEKGSKFFGYCAPALDEEDAQRVLEARSRQYHDATHHCWGMRVGDPVSPVERSADAGEPSGTAGRPILDQIKKSDIVGIIVIVTRWFGGTKLGKGGLVRAYSQSAADALALVKVETRIPQTELTVHCGYEYIGLVEKLAAKYEGQVSGGDYGVDVALRVLLPTYIKDAFVATVIDESAGRVTISTES